MISVLSRYFRKVVGKILGQSQAALYYGDVKDWLAYYRSENKKHHYRQENKRSGICPKVSIIILTYNNLPFNQLCLEDNVVHKIHNLQHYAPKALGGFCHATYQRVSDS